MLQKYINFGTSKKKMHFFEKNSAIKHYFCTTKGLRGVQSPEVLSFKS